MAVVRMSKFSIIGIDNVSEQLMTGLMKLGVTEITSQESKLADEDWASVVSRAKRESEVLEIESKLNATDNALKTFELYDDAKKPLLSSRREITERAFKASCKERGNAQDITSKVNASILRLREIKTTQNKNETDIASLRPWEGYSEPLEILETEYTRVSLGFVTSATDIDYITYNIEGVTELFSLHFVGIEGEQQYLSLIYHKDFEEPIAEILKQIGFNTLSFKGMVGTAAENIVRLQLENDNLRKREKDVTFELANMVIYKRRLQLYYDALTIEKERLRAYDNVLVAGRAFYLEGWVPTDELENLTELLEEYGCHFEFSDPDETDEPPVLLKNNNFIAPVEVVTGLYSLPKYREPDPTPIYALFYICFFGIMFADMGYGFILAMASFVLLKTGKLEGTFRKFIKQLGYCGVSSFIWGLLFGSFFGDLVTVFSAEFLGREVVISPLWFDPIAEPMTMLAFACGFGIFHIFVALGMKAYVLIKSGKVIQAVNDAFLWYVLIIGLLLLLGGDIVAQGATNIGMFMSIFAAAGIVILPIFYMQGAAKALGLWKLYDIVNYLADILSYARLLALCLAGAVIAQVFNMLGGMAAGGVVGTIVFIFIVAAAHTFNFLLSSLGSFVHAIRLQYVEFFGKFFEGNGEPFKPFARNTKYVKIVKEEN